LNPGLKSKVTSITNDQEKKLTLQEKVNIFTS